MINFKIILNVLGYLLIALSLILLIPAFLVEIKKVIPNPRVIIELIMKDCHVSLLKARSRNAGISNIKLNAISK